MKCQNQTSNLFQFKINLSLTLFMCVLFYSSFACISAYANVYLRTTIIKQNIKIILLQNNIHMFEELQYTLKYMNKYIHKQKFINEIPIPWIHVIHIIKYVHKQINKYDFSSEVYYCENLITQWHIDSITIVVVCFVLFFVCVYLRLRISWNPKSIAGVQFDSVRRFQASLLLRTTCMHLCCNWVTNCVAA